MLCRYIKLHLHVLAIGVHVFESFNEKKNIKMHNIFHVTLSSIIVCVIYAFSTLCCKALKVIFYFVERFILFKNILKFNDTEI